MQSKVKQTGLSLPVALAVLLLLFLILAKMSSADFESPPTNMTANTTPPFLLQNKYNSIPGWSFNGTVWYVTSGPKASLPGNGHAVQLGHDGKINQTFKSDRNHMNYVLTFTLAPGSKNCSNNHAAVNVPDF
ncbi:hypothetical protein CJ030_MR3G011057 [Morella rubra]|uniref:DUF642 domain-containing protein n=1 Tax=Morella rubra TaxID=262757 RepID=A0A6A1W450_9ROSI|nr:hypothetical protein CJ030_MR3G011057 [Morella rubra]